VEGLGGVKVLVTGSEGYIGTVLVPLFEAAGHDVVGLDSGLFNDCGYVGGAPRSYQFIAKDVREVGIADLAGVDAVVHLAGISNDPLGDLDAECTYDINHRGTVHLARVAKAAGVGRFAFSSSCSLYGAAGNEYLDETASFNPVTPYGRSKLLSEQDLIAMADDTFSPTYLRNATVYGMSGRLRGDLVVNNLTGYAFTTGAVLMKSDGMPGSIATFADTASPDLRNYRVNCDLIAQTLPEYQPTWTVRAGIEELHQAYLELGLRLDDLTGPRLIRLGHIKNLLTSGRVDSALYPLDASGQRTGFVSPAQAVR
jgi:NAD(P)-dependent dehydrogenase (short-subunit alcohol dehydrogenase family)